jgi:hypothetical protein
LKGVVSDEEFLFAPKEFVVKGLSEEEGRGEVDGGCDVQVEVMIEGFVRHGEARKSVEKTNQQADHPPLTVMISKPNMDAVDSPYVTAQP